MVRTAGFGCLKTCLHWIINDSNPINAFNCKREKHKPKRGGKRWEGGKQQLIKAKGNFFPAFDGAKREGKEKRGRRGEKCGKQTSKCYLLDLWFGTFWLQFGTSFEHLSVMCNQVDGVNCHLRNQDQEGQVEGWLLVHLFSILPVIRFRPSRNLFPSSCLEGSKLHQVKWRPN